MLSTRYSCQISVKLDYFYGFLKNTRISNFMKICPVGAELFHTDRHDGTNSRFPQFCERAEKVKLNKQNKSNKYSDIKKRHYK
jgi:hypothetical protein